MKKFRLPESSNIRFLYILGLVILFEFFLRAVIHQKYNLLGGKIFYGILFLTVATMMLIKVFQLSLKRILWSFFVVIIILLCTLFIYDRFLSKRELLYFPGSDIKSTSKTMRTLELFPYSGWHVQANFHHKGDMPYLHQPYHDYDVKSGSMGFFVDFDINNPPAKQKNEFRIILIGGSGAQGWGGRTNEDMLYKKLEERLNETLKDTGYRFKVINMAMGASISYQNFIDLNRFAHPLEPDFILSYSGCNDINVPIYHEDMNDGFYYFNQLNALAISMRGSEFPPLLKWFVRIFPNIANQTNIGIALKIACFDDYFVERAKKNYAESRGLHYNDRKEFLEKVVIPQYVHSMKSIKRDFSGTPIMIAWQILSKEEIPQNREADLGIGYYNKMFDDVSSQLSGYYNDKWYFINVHKMFENDARLYFGMHLGNEGQKIVADIIAVQMEAPIRSQLKMKAQSRGYGSADVAGTGTTADGKQF